MIPRSTILCTAWELKRTLRAILNTYYTYYFKGLGNSGTRALAETGSVCDAPCTHREHRPRTGAAFPLGGLQKLGNSRSPQQATEHYSQPYILTATDCLVATSTIQLSTEVKHTLQSMKLHPRETFNDVLERLVEDLRELDKETVAEVEEARAAIRAGRYLTQEQVRKAMGL